MISRLRRPSVALFLVAVFAAWAGAAGHARAEGVRLSYKLYGRGFHVMNVMADLRLTPYGYGVVLRDHTVGFMGMMVHADVTSTATGRFVDGGVQPLHFQSIGFSRGAQRTTVLDYVGADPVVRILKPPEPDRDPVVIARARGSVDTLSAMADMVHQVQQTGHCDGSVLIFDGLRLSRARASTVGNQIVPSGEGSAYQGTALRCDFQSLEIGGFLHDASEAEMHRPQDGTAWIAPVVTGAPALPVRIRFHHPKLGIVTMVLTKAEALP